MLPLRRAARPRGAVVFAGPTTALLTWFWPPPPAPSPQSGAGVARCRGPAPSRRGRSGARRAQGGQSPPKKAARAPDGGSYRGQQVRRSVAPVRVVARAFGPFGRQLKLSPSLQCGPRPVRGPRRRRVTSRAPSRGTGAPRQSRETGSKGTRETEEPERTSPLRDIASATHAPCARGRAGALTGFPFSREIVKKITQLTDRRIV